MHFLRPNGGVGYWMVESTDNGGMAGREGGNDRWTVMMDGSPEIPDCILTRPAWESGLILQVCCPRVVEGCVVVVVERLRGVWTMESGVMSGVAFYFGRRADGVYRGVY